MAADSHDGDGSGLVRRLRDQRFVRPSQMAEGISEQQRDFPTFLASASDVRPRAIFVASDLAEAFARKRRAWKARLSRISIRLPTRAEMELCARPTLVLLFLPLAIAASPIMVERAVNNAPSNFVLEDRLSFSGGLRQRLASEAITHLLEQADQIAEVKPQAPMPLAEDPARPPFLEPSPPDARQIPALLVDDRRWRLPFQSQEYALADLPTSPQAAFKTEVDALRFPDEIESMLAQSDVPMITPRARVKRPANRRERVLGYSRRAPQVKRVRAPVAAAVVAEQQEPGGLPPFLFFLGAPPPAEPEAPPVPPNPRLTNRPWLPDTFQNLFKYQD